MIRDLIEMVRIAFGGKPKLIPPFPNRHTRRAAYREELKRSKAEYQRAKFKARMRGEVVW